MGSQGREGKPVTGYNYNHHVQVRAGVCGGPTDTCGTSERLTMCSRAVPKELQEPIHSEALNSGRMCSIKGKTLKL